MSNSENKLAVNHNMVVSLDYALQLPDGQLIDASDEEPLMFLAGAGQIIPGLEKELMGMVIGEEKNVQVAPAEAYGLVDPEAFQEVPLTMFPSELSLSEGMGLRLVDGATGQPVEAYVNRLTAETAVLDFNHPLAGETLHFQVKISDLRQATAEEITHGHAHLPGHSH